MVHLNKSKWALSCPDRHCHINTVNGEVKEYLIYYYPTDRSVRYNIQQTHYYNSDFLSFTKHTKIPQTRLNRQNKIIQLKARREYKSIFKLEAFVPLRVKDDVIQGRVMYEKMKLYTLFS